jgi:hypothetical protein
VQNEKFNSGLCLSFEHGLPEDHAHPMTDFRTVLGGKTGIQQSDKLPSRLGWGTPP